MKTVCLYSAYLAPISYYCQLMLNERVLVEQCEYYVKQTYRNRANIMTANGMMSLTIPVEHCGGEKVLMKDLKISDHGNWRHLHWQALQTAYDKSPFFEYYADDFRPFYEGRPTEYLVDYNMRLQELIFSLINLQPMVALTSKYEKEGDFADLRNVISPKNRENGWLCQMCNGTCDNDMKYYQIFSHRHGFVADLSIVDLLFNMGPEALLVLHRYAEVFQNDTK